jgi:hypothetical protein
VLIVGTVSALVAHRDTTLADLDRLRDELGSTLGTHKHDAKQPDAKQPDAKQPDAKKPAPAKEAGAVAKT